MLIHLQRRKPPNPSIRQSRWANQCRHRYNSRRYTIGGPSRK